MKYGYLEFRYNNKSHFRREEGETAGATINIGDNVQSLAVRSICRRLGIGGEYLVGINRDELANYRGEPVKLLMNGCFYRHCFPLPAEVTPVFFGFNTSSIDVVRENKPLFLEHAPIGCRDCATRDMLMAQGIPAYVSGCLTLTLEKRSQPPADGRVIIAFGAGAGEFPGSLLQHIPKEMLDGASFVFQREPVQALPLGDAEVAMADEVARRRLAFYRDSGGLVITPLLHVASPCMAMGIPVILARKDSDRRFTAIDKLTPVHTPETFHAIDWSPPAIELDAVKAAMENILQRQIRGEAVDKADVAFLTTLYAGESLPKGDSGSSERKKQQEQREARAAERTQREALRKAAAERRLRRREEKAGDA